MKKEESTKLTDYTLKFLTKLSTKGLYVVLLLFYAYKNGDTPGWAKKIIIGSFAYFLNPFDSIPDFTPILGMTDDISVMAFGLVTIACYITEDIRTTAQKQLSKLMNAEVDRSIIEEIHSWL